MKRFLFSVAVLLLCAIAPHQSQANDYQFDYTRTMVANDTTADSIRVDTVYDNTWIDLRGLQTINFWYGTYSWSDTAFTADTFKVYLQHGPRWGVATDSRLMAIGNSVATDDSLIWSSFELSRTDSMVGNWGRFMMIYWDSTEADDSALIGNVYKWHLQVWTSETK